MKVLNKRHIVPTTIKGFKIYILPLGLTWMYVITMHRDLLDWDMLLLSIVLLCRTVRRRRAAHILRSSSKGSVVILRAHQCFPIHVLEARVHGTSC